MPTVLRSGPYRFYFYSHEPNEPPHIHVDRDDATAKFWLTPLNLASSLGFEGHELTTLFRLGQRHEEELIDAWRAASSLNAGARVAGVQFSEDTVSVELADGRTISAPLVWYPRLLNASEADRNAWELAAGGYGIHWPTIDEDLSVEGLLRGAPAHGEDR